MHQVWNSLSGCKQHASCGRSRRMSRLRFLWGRWQPLKSTTRTFGVRTGNLKIWIAVMCFQLNPPIFRRFEKSPKAGPYHQDSRYISLNDTMDAASSDSQLRWRSQPLPILKVSSTTMKMKRNRFHLSDPKIFTPMCIRKNTISFYYCCWCRVSILLFFLDFFFLLKIFFAVLFSIHIFQLPFSSFPFPRPQKFGKSQFTLSPGERLPSRHIFFLRFPIEMWNTGSIHSEERSSSLLRNPIFTFKTFI